MAQGTLVSFIYNDKLRSGKIVIDSAEYIKLDLGNCEFKNFSKCKIVGLTII